MPMLKKSGRPDFCPTLRRCLVIVADELPPALLQLASQLRYPAGGNAEPAGHIAGTFTGGQVVDDPPVPGRQGGKPRREVDPEGGQFGRRGPFVLHELLTPIAVALIAR